MGRGLSKSGVIRLWPHRVEASHPRPTFRESRPRWSDAFLCYFLPMVLRLEVTDSRKSVTDDGGGCLLKMKSRVDR